MKILRKRNIFSSPLLYACLLTGAIALCIRFYFNFSQELIPGINGGYYPLQVRQILTTGHLAFHDMPFLFYFDALLIKIISFTGIPISDKLILNVVKTIDSFSLPLLLLPLCIILHSTKLLTYKYLSISLIAFSVLSFSPLILVSDLQKNALAIVFSFTAFSFYYVFLHKRNKTHVFLSVLFLLLTVLTHFGTAVVAMFFIIIALSFYYKQKAIIPLIIIAALILSSIAIFDLSRFFRLLYFWKEIFSHPILLSKMLTPPDFLLILLSLLFAIYGLFVLQTKKDHLNRQQKSMLISSIICLFIFSFPMLDIEYFKRLSIFLFVLQIILFIQIAPVMLISHRNFFSTILVLFTALSIIAVIGKPPETAISDDAYKDLKNLKNIISNNEETLIIARHGLEWWTAWALKTKVGQDKSLDSSCFEKYKNIIFLTQTNGFVKDASRHPFHEPIPPENSTLIFSSVYFKAYKISDANNK